MKQKIFLRLMWPIILASGLISCDNAHNTSSNISVDAPVNSAPVAHAGYDQQVLVGQQVQHIGTLSSDPDGDELTYFWSFKKLPPGSQVAHSDPTHHSPIFVPDVPGIYVAHLEVHDGQVSSDDEAAVSQIDPLASNATVPQSRQLASGDTAPQIGPLASGAVEDVTINAKHPGTACCIENQFQINTADCPTGPTFAWKNISECPADSGVIKIGAEETCQYAYVDETNEGLALGNIDILEGGRLVFLDKGESVKASAISLQGGTMDALPPGQLVLGTDVCPVQLTQVTVEFQGEPKSTNLLANKGIIVGADGELVLHGKKGVVAEDPSDNSGSNSWTYLSQAAGPAQFSEKNKVAAPVPTLKPDTTLTLARAVDWQPMDWIVVAGTGFASDQTEFVQIDEVDSSGRVITLKSETPLKHYHYGGKAPSMGTIPAGTNECNGVPLEGDARIEGLPASFCDPKERNFGVDERAEVGLISRNVKFTSDAPATGEGKHYGGQLKILVDYKIAEIEGVEFEKFGQDVIEVVGGMKMSSYPVHFHMVGDVTPNTLVNSNSVHHSYNKCFTLHLTNNAELTHNVCARNVGHSYYLEGGVEVGNAFRYNLAAGTMATEFTPSLDTTQFWTGDYLANPSNPDYNQYNGINVATTSDVLPQPNKVEVSAPTAFWISSPGNTFEHNSVAGCQLQGRGYWILPETTAVQFTPIRSFTDNRVHGCYNGLDTAADLDSMGENYLPRIAGKKDVIAKFVNDTVTRNRNRGIWLRPAWYQVEGARLATNRDSVSLVSAGGAEGSPPGEWGLINDSVIVGLSQNNPERFGPCPANAADGTCYGMGGQYRGHGIPDPGWNFAGFMFYDGPARLENNHFVNFLVNPVPLMTMPDANFLTSLSPGRTPGSTVPPYEGDAAMGWFQSNVNNYPPTQYSLGNIWQNVDLRHQVYTEEVFLAAFVDGDKNTVILDRDGTLSGFKVVDKDGKAVPGKYPISLNNLAFNGSPYSVDECLATGAQDLAIENRASALMSPHSFATLELTSFDPTYSNASSFAKKTPITLVKDAQDYIEYNGPYAPPDDHYFMTLVGRNNTQVREPKVMNGMGYTLHSSEECVVGGGSNVVAPPAAFPRFLSVGYTDASSRDEVDTSGNWARPFRTRLGICYKTEKGPDVSVVDPEKFFEVKMGRVTYGSDASGATDPNWVPITSPGTGCNNLAFSNGYNFDPAGGTDPTLIQPDCPGTLDATNDPVKTLTSAPSWADFVSTDNDDRYYWWDKDKGMLFFYVEQKEPNLAGGTPLGSCPNEKDPACENANNFYACPKEGCVLYTVRVVDKPDGENGTLGYAPTRVGNDYGATTCDNIYKDGSGTSGPPNNNYTQGYPPNDTVNWEVDRLSTLDGRVLLPSSSPSSLIEAVPKNEGKFVCNNIPMPPAPACALGDLNMDCENNFPHNTFKGDAGFCPIHPPTL